MSSLPFLRPSVVAPATYLHYLEQMQQSAWYSNFGPLNSRFEQRIIAELFGASGSATTVSNATLGLMVAIQAVKRPGARYALMPSFTFAATPLAAQWCGLEPYFVDCDPDTWCLCPQALAQAVALLGDQVAVVVPYATFGYAMDLAPYNALLAQDIPVVIDAAPCLGSQVAGQQFGRDFAGLVVFSMHATKAFSVGEGGLIYSASAALIATIRRLLNYGFDQNRSADLQGMNAKLPEVLAAISLATLDVYPAKVAQRMALFNAYTQAINSSGLIDAGWRMQSHAQAVAHQFLPLIAPAHLRNTDLVKQMASQDIEVRTYFAPACHQQPQFASCRHDGLAVTDQLAAGCLSLPLWEMMPQTAPATVVQALAKISGTAPARISTAGHPQSIAA